MNKIRVATILILFLSLVSISCGSTDDNGDITTEFGAVFVSSNTTPVVGIYDFSSSTVGSVQFGLSSTDSDGIIYSSGSDRLYIASRTNNRVEVYTDLTKNILDDEFIGTKLKDQHPMKRFGTPEEVAETICFLASDKASAITGQCINVDCGVFPS